MASTFSLSVLIIGHSYICHLSDFCEEGDIPNFGLPHHFHADIFALSGAALCDLPTILLNLISHAPNMTVFFELESFDLLSLSIIVASEACSFHAFLHFSSSLIASCMRCYPVIFLLEQHYWLYTPASSVSSVILNRHLAQWNVLWHYWSVHASFFSFLNLLLLNWAMWPAGLVQGHLLHNVAMPVYLLNMLCAVLLAEFIF